MAFTGVEGVFREGVCHFRRFFLLDSLSKPASPSSHSSIIDNCGLKIGFIYCMKAKAQNDHMHTNAMKVSQIDSLCVCRKRKGLVMGRGWGVGCGEQYAIWVSIVNGRERCVYRNNYFGCLPGVGFEGAGPSHLPFSYPGIVVQGSRILITSQSP